MSRAARDRCNSPRESISNRSLDTADFDQQQSHFPLEGFDSAAINYNRCLAEASAQRFVFIAQEGA